SYPSGVLRRRFFLLRRRDACHNRKSDHLPALHEFGLRLNEFNSRERGRTLQVFHKGRNTNVVKGFPTNLQGSAGVLNGTQPHLVRQTMTDFLEPTRRTALCELEIFNRSDFFLHLALFCLKLLDLFDDLFEAPDLLLHPSEILLTRRQLAILGGIGPNASTDKR